MAKRKVRDHLRLMRWADDGFPPINLQEELKAVLELINEIRFLRQSQPAEKVSMEAIINEPVWIVYALDLKTLKKIHLCVGHRGFRVVHGKEIVYEGPHLANAIEKYNAITSLPNLKDSPKLDN